MARTGGPFLHPPSPDAIATTHPKSAKTDFTFRGTRPCPHAGLHIPAQLKRNVSTEKRVAPSGTVAERNGLQTGLRVAMSSCHEHVRVTR